jgi:flavin-dependent dehydrogenase
MYDVAVLGGTPAGFAAACHLAGKGVDVAVVGPPPHAIECPLWDWVPRGFFRLSFLPKTFPRRCGAVSFRRICYHNVSMTDVVRYTARASAGHFVHADKLTKALKSAASKAGASVRSTQTEPAIRLEEDAIALVGTTQTWAKLLIIASDRPSEVISELALPARTVPRSSLSAAGLDVPVGNDAELRALRGALHIVEMPERSELGMFFVSPDSLHLRMISSTTAAGVRAAELSAMLNGLQQAGLLPASLALARARGAVWRPPAGVALELETHVAKRCLLAGTAGGFVDSITGHTLWPTVKSALLAAEVVSSALKSRDPQEALMSFKDIWRSSLADYLRPPNTSLHMLLPLLFANRRVASKFTRALLYGANI